jgi:hypothetical protein
MRVDLNKENIVVYILSKSLPKCSTNISQVILFKSFLEILPKYSTDTSSNIFFLLEKYPWTIFKVPTIIFL